MLIALRVTLLSGGGAQPSCIDLRNRDQFRQLPPPASRWGIASPVQSIQALIYVITQPPPPSCHIYHLNLLAP